MESSDKPIINLFEAVSQPLELQCHLTGDFFKELEQDEITDGDVQAVIHVKHSAGDVFTVDIEAEGDITTLCDRCLDEATFPVTVTEQIKLRFGDPDNTEASDDEYDVRVLPYSTRTYDLSWDLYEILELALPLQRLHAEGDCNEEMTKYIMTEE